MTTAKSEFNIVDGVVVDSSDPQQMGRIKVWCPALDGPEPLVDNLPWTNYVSPLAGQTSNYPGGSSGAIAPGYHSYGFWAIPKRGAQVLVAVTYGDVNRRYYLGSIFGNHGNRSLPAGRNHDGPVTDTLDPVQPQTENLKAQFGGNINSSQAKTRGSYERAVAQDKTEKDGKEGYQESVVLSDHELDSQTYCLTTPGRHVILFQDNPANSRVRIKSAEGHQIIMDDANERIYISTNSGKTWLEMDSDGHVHLYGADSISVSSGGDINFTATGNFNASAGGNVNISAGGHARFTGCKDVSLSGDVLNITSGGAMNLLATGEIKLTSPQIHMNGSPASEAPCADSPTITPNHEPWDRPATKGRRGNHWNP
jgi:hypothetical protein